MKRKWKTRTVMKNKTVEERVMRMLRKKRKGKKINKMSRLKKNRKRKKMEIKMKID